jgi:deoxyadenosine/deoxycytidine kinase
MSGKQIVICLEGTIAAGKTTVLKHLQQYSDFAILPEQIESWQHVPGTPTGENANLLKLFYADQEKYSYHFQNLALLTQLQNHLKPDPAPVKIIERSVHSSYHVFAGLLYANKKLTTMEHSLLALLYQQLMDMTPCQVDYYLYLDVPPVAAQMRLERRGRTEERESTQLTREYLEQLQVQYDLFLKMQTAPVLRVNGLQPTSQVLNDVIDQLSSVYNPEPQGQDS